MNGPPLFHWRTISSGEEIDDGLSLRSEAEQDVLAVSRLPSVSPEHALKGGGDSPALHNLLPSLQHCQYRLSVSILLYIPICLLPRPSSSW